SELYTPSLHDALPISMVMCLKLGWDDFRTAFWLRRRDPSRRRGRACFWLYLANGFWKVSAIGLVVSLLFILIAILPRLGQRVGLDRKSTRLNSSHVKI